MTDHSWGQTWRALPWAERRRIGAAVRRGARLVRPEEAALAAWLALRKLQRWPLVAVGILAVLVWPALLPLPAGVLGAVAYLWAGGVLASPVLVWLYCTNRRPALRRALETNLQVAAGLTPPGPPDPSRSVWLLRRIEREGWLRSLRHHRRHHL